MLFQRRTWATRIVHKMGLPMRSHEATLLTGLAIWASKQQPVMVDRADKSLTKRDRVLLAAMEMADNQSAVLKVAEELTVHPLAAEELLDRFRRSAISLAKENGLEEIANVGMRARMRSLSAWPE
jgi:hypothetical protein